MTKQIPKTIYGPVKSWRLGNSLGVDLLCLDSICSFQCVYCQLGKINNVTTERKVFVSTERVINDVKNSDLSKSDVITFSGSGEPTLAKNLGEVIEKIKKITGKPVVVLTNSTLLNSEEVRSEVMQADNIFCKLDAWSEAILHKVNRPDKHISLESIINGITRLRREYCGFLAIQTMILRVPNDLEICKFAKILNYIKPDEVQLNVPSRPIPIEYSLQTRGNIKEYKQDFTKLKTISKVQLEIIRQKLSRFTDITLIIR